MIDYDKMTTVLLIDMGEPSIKINPGFIESFKDLCNRIKNILSEVFNTIKMDY